MEAIQAKLANRLKAEASTSEAEQAQRQLLAADIKRFLERPAETMHVIPAPYAPPGAPIGEPAMDWLARPPIWTGTWIDAPASRPAM